MAIAHRQFASAVSAFDSLAASFASNTLAASAVAVWVISDQSTQPVVTDTQLNVYTFATSIQWASATPDQWLFVFTTPSTSAAANTVTATLATALFEAIVITEVTGAATSGVVDVFASAVGTSTTPSSGATGAMSQNNGLVMGFIASNVSATKGASYTLRAQFSNNWDELTEDKVVTGGGTQTADATLGSSTFWAAVCVVLKEAGGAGATFGDTRAYSRGMKRGMRPRLHRRNG